MIDGTSTIRFAHQPDRRRAIARLRLILLPALVALAVCVPKCWQGDFNVDTGWYSAIALQAYRGVAEPNGPQSGIASLLSLQGSGAPGRSLPYFNKPPLAFWLNGAPLAIFGPSIWAARLGSILAVVLTVIATTLLVRRASGIAAARAAGLVLATSIPFVSLGRSFSLDAWMTLLLTVAIGFGMAAVRRPRAAAWLGLGAVVGLALLVKPLVALLIVPVFGAWYVLVRSPRRAVWLIPATILAIVIAGSWHGWMDHRFGDEFRSRYLGREIVDRAAGDRAAATFNTGAQSPFYYLVVLAQTYWPWLVTVVLAIAALLSGRPPRRGPHDRRANDSDHLYLGLIWTLVWLVGLSLFADKRPRYLAPLFPVWAWMSALWLTRWWGGGAVIRAAWRRLARAIPAVAVGLAIVLSVVPFRAHKPQDANWTSFLAWIDEHPDAAVWQGGFVGQRMAKVYLHTGRWPHATTDALPGTDRDPPAGSYLLYHTRDGLAPGPNEQVVLKADKLLITQLKSAPWTPVHTPDPGE